MTQRRPATHTTQTRSPSPPSPASAVTAVSSPDPHPSIDDGPGRPPGPPRTTHQRIPWRAAAVGAGTAVPSVCIGAICGETGELIAVIALIAMLVITGTALFGSQAVSERAFRLLRWITNQPEPPAP
jgi:hypothetical protein